MAETDITDYVLTRDGWKMTMCRDGFDGTVERFQVDGLHFAAATKRERSTHTSGFAVERSIDVTVLINGAETDELMRIHGKTP
jgi:hypothetical protein